MDRLLRMAARWTCLDPLAWANGSHPEDAQTQRDVLRTLLPEIEVLSRSKKEFERRWLVGIRTNIDTRAAMQKAAQDAGLVLDSVP